jgi:putative transposase
VFRRRKLLVGSSWRIDRTCVLVVGQWNSLYRAVDKLGQAVDFLPTARRDVVAARRFFERAIDLHDMPQKITITSVAQCGRGARPDRRQRCGH